MATARKNTRRTSDFTRGGQAWETAAKKLEKTIVDVENFLSKSRDNCKPKGLRKFPIIPRACASLEVICKWIIKAEDTLKHNTKMYEDEVNRRALKVKVSEIVKGIKRIGGQFNRSKSR